MFVRYSEVNASGNKASLNYISSVAAIVKRSIIQLAV